MKILTIFRVFSLEKKHNIRCVGIEPFFCNQTKTTNFYELWFQVKICYGFNEVNTKIIKYLWSTQCFLFGVMRDFPPNQVSACEGSCEIFKLRLAVDAINATIQGSAPEVKRSCLERFRQVRIKSGQKVKTWRNKNKKMRIKFWRLNCKSEETLLNFREYERFFYSWGMCWYVFSSI